MARRGVQFRRLGPTGKYGINFDYDPALIDWIKTNVPGYLRSYDRDTKTWTVTREWAERLAADWKQAGYVVVGMEKEQERARRAPPPPPPRAVEAREGWAHELLRRAGTPELRASIHRQLSKALHTDLGGDQALQQELNDARAAFDRGGQNGQAV